MATPIVLDIGTAFTKVGFAGEESPKWIIPTIIAPHKNVFREKAPILGSIVNDWDAVENFLKNLFDEILKIDPTQHPIVFLEPQLMSQEDKDRMEAIFINKIGIPGVVFSNQALMVLFAYGLTSGCVVDLGHGFSHIVPIYKGQIISDAIARLEIGGLELDKYLLRLLMQDGYIKLAPATQKERDAITQFKENYCFIAFDLEGEVEQFQKFPELVKKFKSPNGKEVLIGITRFLAPECLFQPDVAGKEELGIDEALVNSILMCPREMRRELFNNIVLTGGSSMIPGLAERLHNEVKFIIPESVSVRIHSRENRALSAWIGGSIFASVSK